MLRYPRFAFRYPVFPSRRPKRIARRAYWVVVLYSLAFLLACILPAAPVNADEIEVANNSCKPLKLLVRYLDSTTDQWTTRGFYQFAPGEEAYLASKGGRLRTDNDIIYYWASYLDNTDGWSGTADDPDDNFVSFGGRRYLMDMHRDRGYDVDLTLGTEYDGGKCEDPKITPEILDLAKAISDRGGDKKDVAWLKNNVQFNSKHNVYHMDANNVSRWPQWARRATSSSESFSSLSCSDGGHVACDVVKDEEFKNATAFGTGTAAAVGCSFFIGPFGVICGLVVNSVVKTVWNCSRPKPVRDIVRDITGRGGCIEIALVSGGF